VLELLLKFGLQQRNCRMLSRTSREYFAVRSNQARHLVTTTPNH